jgi:hypothetical protein
VTLERATRLAFRGRLAEADRLLESADPSDLDVVWLRAYVGAARGDFASAERRTRGILRSSRASTAIKARAAVTLGSVLRQQDRHAEARIVEAAALRRTRGDERRAHLLIGLAADAVGLGTLADVDANLARVPRAGRDWRVRVRLGWVRCERELLAGRPLAGVRYARAAAALAARHGAVRHEAKSHLFLGAALLDVIRRDPRRSGLTPHARRALRRAQTLAKRAGARPIARVAGDLLAAIGRPRRG